MTIVSILIIVSKNEYPLSEASEFKRFSHTQFVPSIDRSYNFYETKVNSICWPEEDHLIRLESYWNEICKSLWNPQNLWEVCMRKFKIASFVFTQRLQRARSIYVGSKRTFLHQCEKGGAIKESLDSVLWFQLSCFSPPPRFLALGLRHARMNR